MLLLTWNCYITGDATQRLNNIAAYICKLYQEKLDLISVEWERAVFTLFSMSSINVCLGEKRSGRRPPDETGYL